MQNFDRELILLTVNNTLASFIFDRKKNNTNEVKEIYFRILLKSYFRIFLQSFRLPGEAPVISMIMEIFGEHWHQRLVNILVILPFSWMIVCDC